MSTIEKLRNKIKKLRKLLNPDAPYDRLLMPVCDQMGRPYPGLGNPSPEAIEQAKNTGAKIIKVICSREAVRQAQESNAEIV
jgi:hypothetical protein